MFAAAKKLDNFIAIVDNNGLQIDGPIDEVNSPYPIVEKFEAFGFKTLTADAHDFDSLDAAFNEADKADGRPVAIVMKSVKGKGVSYMENNVSWHGAAPNAEQYAIAVKEIEDVIAALEA